MRCHYKISKKEKVHTKYYQKHLNLVSTFSTSANINFFSFFILLLCILQNHVMVQRGEMKSNGQMRKKESEARGV